MEHLVSSKLGIPHDFSLRILWQPWTFYGGIVVVVLSAFAVVVASSPALTVDVFSRRIGLVVSVVVLSAFVVVVASPPARRVDVFTRRVGLVVVVLSSFRPFGVVVVVVLLPLEVGATLQNKENF